MGVLEVKVKVNPELIEIDAVALPVQVPVAPITVYVVAVVGLAITLDPFAELKVAALAQVYEVAPLTVNVSEPPAQILELLGVTVKLKFGLNPTFMEAVAVPQVPMAVTEIVPALAPKLTVIAFELVGADVILAPAGTNQV